MLGSRRTALFLLSAGASLLVVVPGSASGAVTLGSTFTPVVVCPMSATMVQATSDGNIYAAPSAGVITSWAHHAGPTPPPLRFKVVRPLGGNTFALVGESVLSPQTALVLNEFPVRIPVQSGDTIGLYLGGSGYTFYNCVSSTGSPADLFYYTIGEVPSGSTAYTAGTGPQYRIDVSAQFEPDADGDGFGDETQDRCPSDAAVLGACPPRDPSTSSTGDDDPPETTITKGAPNTTDKTNVGFRFRSDEPGATFQCKLDRKPFKPCSSPRRIRRLTKGVHEFKVRAIDAAGNVDSSPAKDRFKVMG
jgi:hypothetical protein